MNSEIPIAQRSFALVVGVGTLQGLALWWLSGALTDGTWPATHAAWYLAFLLNAVFLPPVIYGLATWSARPLTWLLVAAAAVLMLGCGAHFGLQIDTESLTGVDRRFTVFPMLVPAFVLLFHGTPFAQSFLDTGRWRPDYSQLFSQTWRNALQLALAGLFTGVFWLLLVLGLQLFDMIGIHFPKALFFSDPRFTLLVAAIAFAVGFHMAGSADRLLLILRQQVLSLLKWLALVATVILVLFAIALLLRTPELLATQQHVIRATWLLWLAVVTVYLYNAAYQDGHNAQPYPRIAGNLLRYATPLLLLISAMAFYALCVRVHAYGLTVARVWGLLVAVIALGYAASYCWVALRGGAWMAGMGTANVGVALLLIAALALLLSPVLAPERVAARSIAGGLAVDSRALNRQNLETLRFNTGSYGVEELRRLAAADGHASVVSRLAGKALAVESSYQWGDIAMRKVDAAALVLESFPTGTPIEGALREQIASAMNPYVTGYYPYQNEDADPQHAPTMDANGNLLIRSSTCTAQAPCPVLFVDLDGDNVAEALAYYAGQPHAFRKHEGQWLVLALSETSTARCGACSEAQVLRDLRAGRFQTLDAGWKNLQIGNRRWVVVAEH